MLSKLVVPLLDISMEAFICKTLSDRIILCRSLWRVHEALDLKDHSNHFGLIKQDKVQKLDSDFSVYLT